MFKAGGVGGLEALNTFSIPCSPRTLLLVLLALSCVLETRVCVLGARGGDRMLKPETMCQNMGGIFVGNSSFSPFFSTLLFIYAKYHVVIVLLDKNSIFRNGGFIFIAQLVCQRSHNLAMCPVVKN